MLKQQSLKKNYIYRMIYEISAIIIPFITTPYISRVLGGDGVGIYSYTSSIMTVFIMFATLGTATYGMREIARCRDNKQQYSKVFWEIEGMTIITSLITLTLWLILSKFYTEYTVYLYALTPLLLGAMFDINWFFMGQEMVLYTVLRNMIVKVLGMILLFVFVRTKNDLVLYIFLQSVVNMLGSLSMWTYLPHYLCKVDYKNLHMMVHFRQTLVYFVPTIASTVYTVLDKTLIGFITHDSYQNGYYEQAVKLMNILKTVAFTAVNSVMSARISYLYAHEQYDEIKMRIKKSMDYIILLTVGAAFGISGIAHNFVPLFYGKGFEAVEILLYCMSPLLIIIGISNCLGNQYYTPSGRRAESSRYIIMGALTNLVLNLCLIPRWKAQGAVIASVIAESVISALYVIHCKGYLTFSMIWFMLWKRLIAGLIMMVFAFQIGQLNISVIPRLALQIVSGAMVYILILIILGDQMVLGLFSYGRSILNKIFRREG